MDYSKIIFTTLVTLYMALIRKEDRALLESTPSALWGSAKGNIGDYSSPNLTSWENQSDKLK